MLLYSSNAAEIRTEKIRGLKVTPVGNKIFKQAYRRRVALCVGINNYKYYPGLECAVNDATAMASLLKGLGFDDVTLLTNRNADKNNILEELIRIKAESHKDDLFVLYFAGHGQTVKKNNIDSGYLENDSESGLQKWLKIPGVISVYVDMIGSTKLSAEKYDQSTAKVYKYFTDSAIRIFHEFGSSYIDIKGDGVFALFNSDEVHRALCSAITFKTQANKKIIPDIKAKTGIQDIGTHIGIDQNIVLVKKIGLRKHNNHDNERQNEVWAGEPINMSAKLASKSKDGQIIISDRYYNNLTSDKAITTCGCVDGEEVNQKSAVWTPEDITNDANFSFNTIYNCGSCWCKNHGNEYCAEIMKADE